MTEALLAAAVLAMMALLSGSSGAHMAMAALINWMPVFILAALLGHWRSLTLTLQVSVIVALTALLGIYAVLGDPSVFWSTWLADDAATLFREMGLHEQAAALVENKAAIAQQMTVLFVFTIWSLYAFGLLLGYALYQASLGQESVFGRFCDLNFGRVLALLMAVASVAAVISGVVWLRNFAFLVFVIFWIQGLAILHWLRTEKQLPAVFLVVVYALIPLLSALPYFQPALLGHWRSLTLTLQVSVIVALTALLGIYAVLGDPSVFWSTWLADDAATLFREMGLHEQAAALVENKAAIAQQMTVLFVFTIWSLYAFGLLLGYALYQASLGQESVFGRFCDLNFGRVLALLMAVASVAAVISGVVWLRNFAFLVFVIFWIQGLAILHWLRTEKQLPAVFLVVVYALIPLLSALPVISFAVVGYTDAWFGYRTRNAGR